MGSSVQAALLRSLGIDQDPGAETPTGISAALRSVTDPGHLQGIARQGFQPPAPQQPVGYGGGFDTGYSGGQASAPGVLRDAAMRAGFTGQALEIALAVAMAEGGGRPGAIGDNGQSVSSWQIHMPSHPNYDRNRLLSDPYYAAQAAYQISGGGRNWNPWTMYRNGGYRRYL